MTDYSNGGEYVVFSDRRNSYVDEGKNKGKVAHVNGFKDFLKTFFSDAINATNANIAMHEDAFLFRFKSGQKEIELEYTVSDYNHIKTSKLKPVELLNQNRSECLDAIGYWIDEFVEPSEQDMLRKQAKEAAAAI